MNPPDFNVATRGFTINLATKAQALIDRLCSYQDSPPKLTAISLVVATNPACVDVIFRFEARCFDVSCSRIHWHSGVSTMHLELLSAETVAACVLQAFYTTRQQIAQIHGDSDADDDVDDDEPETEMVRVH